MIDLSMNQNTAVDFLYVSFRNTVNEYYVAVGSESIRSTLDMERQNGDFIGSFAKYGLKKDPSDHHKLVIDEPDRADRSDRCARGWCVSRSENRSCTGFEPHRRRSQNRTSVAHLTAHVPV